MSFYHWTNCPSEVRAQVNQLISVFTENIPALSGVYLHGSLAMGCFNPAHSDLDLLVVTQKKITASVIPPILHCLLTLSRKPIPIEISFLNEEDLIPWKHPALYDLHYSEDWRNRVTQQLMDGFWEQQYLAEKRDIDLAAHITISRIRGVRLWGEACAAVFPDVPLIDYADSILSDVAWTRERMLDIPVYTVLNLCRVYAFIRNGLIFSKAEGAQWGLKNLEEKWQSTIWKAIHYYQSESLEPTFTDSEIMSFYNEMVEKINRGKSITQIVS